jgi:CRP/FNR family cyclic AMP-dependent transcriptional regulator
MVCREMRLRDRHLLELLGPGDVLQPPGAADDGQRIGTEVMLTATVAGDLLTLGPPFIRAVARWPSLLVAVQRRLEAQRERLAMQALIAHLPKAEHRLLLMMWHLAQRWGIVTADGIVLPLALSHDILAQLIGTRRSTATLSLIALERAQEVKRLSDGSWLLMAKAEHAVEAIARTSEAPRSYGEILATRLRSSEILEQARALRAEANLAGMRRTRHEQRRDGGRRPFGGAA